MPGSLSALLGALWLLGLYAAAPVIRTALRETREGAAEYALADRVRDAAMLGIAIPLVLAALRGFYPFACWAVLAVCIAVAQRRKVATAMPGALPYLTLAAIALVAWPPLMRPPLDGDTLSYHLPNAAAWANAHSLWTPYPRYWWYPPASELFASGLFATGGPFVTGWSGLVAILLLALRLNAWSRVLGAPAMLADAVTAAAVTALPLALQAGSMQNDVWLAAFFLETMWAASLGSAAAIPAAAVTALLKPYGIVFALLAALAVKARPAVWIAGAGAIALWALHDAILWHASVVPPASTSYANSASTTILANGFPALALLATALANSSVFALLAYLAALAGPLLAPADRRAIGWAACGAALLFLAMPLAYADTQPQLATGASLRYAAPAFALGALLLARVTARYAVAATWAFGLLAGAGAWRVLALYWNDAPTRAAAGVALVTIALVALARRVQASWPVYAGVAVAVVAAAVLAMRQPAAYYADALSVNRAGDANVYAWIARAQPQAVGAWGLRLGAVNVLDPLARAMDLPEDDPCAAARARGVVLIAVAESTRAPAFNAARLAAARACATVRYGDLDSVVAVPPEAGAALRSI